MKKIKSILTVLLAVAAIRASAQQNIPPSTPETYKGVVGKTLAESKEWWPKPIHAPAGSPNIVWILLDDVGFGASATFGGLISTPNFDTLANAGLRYTNFHTAGICAPTRSALLTGRNHHYVHMGNFAHASSAAGFPGYDGRIPPDKGTIAEVLRANGYSTFAVGKWGITPDEDTTDVGPFDRWPTGKGFDHHFGFLESATDQYHPPHLVEDNFHVKTDGRNLNEQITDKAIAYIDRAHKAAPDKPFFLYYAPGATHAPHQVAKEWSDLYKGKFDEGWDVYREKVFENQKRLGYIPAYAQLPDRNERIEAWKSLPPDERKLYARFMEVYAGYLTYIDDQVGRVITHLKQTGQFDNTLIFVMIGDNGASKEGTLHGVIKPSKNSPATTPEKDYIKNNEVELEQIGTPEASTNYPLGWAQAANTPFKYWKSDADAEGGTHNPLIIYYPKLIKEKGGIRTQYSHVTDIFPTTIQIAGLQYPEYIKGIKQDTLQGKSLYNSLNDPKALTLHTSQYYYIFASRSIYKDGWKAEAAHHPDNVDYNFPAGKPKIERDYDKDVWKLYNLNEDFNERIDLAKKYPEKLKELKEAFDAEAKKNHIYPFIDHQDLNDKLIHHLENNN